MPQRACSGLSISNWWHTDWRMLEFNVPAIFSCSPTSKCSFISPVALISSIRRCYPIIRAMKSLVWPLASMKWKRQCCFGRMWMGGYLWTAGIPHHIVDSREVFLQGIVDFIQLQVYAGTTPCLSKQWSLVHYAREQLAWLNCYGSICPNQLRPYNGRNATAVDCNKDQSHFSAIWQAFH